MLRVILLIAPLLFCSTSETDSLFFNGKNLYQSGKYFHSVTELKRYLFFDSLHVHRYEANLLIGKAYKIGGFYDNAARYISDARNFSGGGDNYILASIELAKNELLRNRAANSVEILKTAEARNKNPELAEEILYWRAVCLMFMEHYLQAAQLMDSLGVTDSLSQMCRFAEEEKVNPANLRLMSAILPGSGQIYLGEYSSGLLSLIWSGFWGYLMVDAISENRIFDGLMTGNFLFSRFYNGNIKNTAAFAENHNISVRNALLKFFHEKYSGKKPEW